MRLVGRLLELLLRIFVTFLSDFPVLYRQGWIVSFVFIFIYYVSKSSFSSRADANKYLRPVNSPCERTGPAVVRKRNLPLRQPW